MIITIMKAIGLFQKKNQTGGVEDILETYLNLPLEFFIFLLYPWKFWTKQSSTPWKFNKFVLGPMEIPRPKTKTPGNSTLFFLGHPWKFHFVFY